MATPAATADKTVNVFVRQYKNGQVDMQRLAKDCIFLIEWARRDGLIIDEGNVIDLIADNVTNVTLNEIKEALQLAGYADKFPNVLNK